MSNEDVLEELRWKKFPVLDDGFVCLVDAMGDDAAVVQAARVSYGEGTKKVSDDRGLIRYCMRHNHGSPFEMAEIKLLVRVPMDCWRQWIRHRTANVNEYSTRYSVAIDSIQKTSPEEWRLQSSDNKQGSSGLLHELPSIGTRTIRDDMGDLEVPERPGRDLALTMTCEEIRLHNDALAVYRRRLERGIAREQARKDLPLSTYTEAYWKIDLHNLLHFLGLRMDSHAQLEIRQYATIIGEQIVKPMFPLVWEAFLDYRFNAMTLSALEQDAISDRAFDSNLLVSEYGFSKREVGDYLEKCKRLGIQ